MQLHKQIRNVANYLSWLTTAGGRIQLPCVFTVLTELFFCFCFKLMYRCAYGPAVYGIVLQFRIKAWLIESWCLCRLLWLASSCNRQLFTEPLLALSNDVLLSIVVERIFVRLHHCCVCCCCCRWGQFQWLVDRQLRLERRRHGGGSRRHHSSPQCGLVRCRHQWPGGGEMHLWSRRRKRLYDPGEHVVLVTISHKKWFYFFTFKILTAVNFNLGLEYNPGLYLVLL